jgi:hypothetical protein
MKKIKVFSDENCEFVEQKVNDFIFEKIKLSGNDKFSPKFELKDLKTCCNDKLFFITIIYEQLYLKVSDY